jgi:hypothetical protein
VDVCCFSGIGSAGIDHNDRYASGIAFFAFQQTLKKDWMAFGCVGANEECNAAVIEVVVAAGRAVRSETSGVPSHG